MTLGSFATCEQLGPSSSRESAKWSELAADALHSLTNCCENKSTSSLPLFRLAESRWEKPRTGFDDANTGDSLRQRLNRVTRHQQRPSPNGPGVSPTLAQRDSGSRKLPENGG